MDWSKAKTILIVALIIINILFGYILFFEDNIVESTINKNFILNVEELLNKNHIFISTEIPNKVPYLSTLTVEYESKDINTINNDFFNGMGYVQVKGESLIEIVDKSKNLTIINNKLLIYEDNKKIEKFKDLTEDTAIKIAMKFLEEKKYDTSDLKISFIKKEKDIFYIEFSKLYKGKYLESAFTNIQVDKRGVKKLERLWLKEKDIGEIPIYISTAPKAILKLLSMNEVQGKTIKDISLCYYFDPGRHDYIEDPKDARQGKAIPAWRIQFEDGYKVFIED